MFLKLDFVIINYFHYFDWTVLEFIKSMMLLTRMSYKCYG